MGGIITSYYSLEVQDCIESKDKYPKMEIGNVCGGRGGGVAVEEGAALLYWALAVQ